MDIDNKVILDFIQAGIKEDVGTGDHTSQACIPENHTSKAKLLVKNDGIIAGIELAKMIFMHLDPSISFIAHKSDGDYVSYGDIAFEIEGNTRSILMGERLSLNNMQHMSGIATLSRRFLDEVAGTDVTLLDTRKTTPLNRYVEKWAVNIGGCTNYRSGLYDWIMIKDNHVDAAGGIEKALDRVHRYQKENNLNLGITLEVRNLVEVHKAVEVGGFTRIMFDNFEIPFLYEAVKIVDGRYETEASGGVNLNSVSKIANTGVDFISIGALTHSAEHMDLSLKITQ